MNARKKFLSILVILFLVAPLTNFSSAGSWIISTDQTIEGKTIVLSKNIVIESGVNLVIKNSTIIFNCTYNSQYGINVNGGSIYIYNSVIKSQGEDGFHFYVNESSILKMENTSIINAYTSLYPGLIFASVAIKESKATIENCEFSHSGFLLTYKSNATVSNCYFSDSIMGIKVDSSNVTISGCNFISLLHGSAYPISLIEGYKGHLSISGCSFTNKVKQIAGHTIALGKMDAEINDCYIVQNGNSLSEESAGIHLINGNYSISNVRIEYFYSKSSQYDTTQRYSYGIHAKDAELNIKNSLITGAGYGVYVENSALSMEKTAVEKNIWGIYSSSSNISIEECNIINNSQQSVKVEGDCQNIDIHYCNIYGNGMGMVKDTDTLADVRNNYWGSSSGPYVKRGDEIIHKGEGDRIYIFKGNLLYEPWLTEKATNVSNFTIPNASIKLPLLTILGSVSPRVAPGIKSMEKVLLENDGEEDAVFLIAILTPFYVDVKEIKGGEIIASTPEVKIVSVYLKSKYHTYLTIYFTVPPSMVFGENASLKFNSKYLPCVVAEFANLPMEKWNELRNKYGNVDELLNEAWNISNAREKNFFDNFTKLDYEKQLDTLLDLYKANPVLSDYIAWTMIYNTFNEKLMGKEEGQSKASFLMMASAQPDVNGEIPKGAWGKTKWYVKEFFNREFLPTAWEGLKGLGAGAVNAATFGLVDIKSQNDYMQAGKIIGEIAGNIEMVLASGAIGEIMSEKTGVQSLQFFSKMRNTNYRTLLGLEARYSNGAYGNIIKIAENPRFGGWYLGIGHHTEKVIQLAAEGKAIYPGWFHYYFTTGKIASWVPAAASYAEFNLYSAMWNAAKFGSAAVLAGSLVGDGAREFKMVRSLDPNCMEAMPEEYVKNASERITYTIHFENLANATAPAYNVRVEIPVSENLNKSSIKLVSSSHPDKLKYFNVSGDKIEAVFKGINLPPNKNPPEGEGWIAFSIKPKEGIESGDEIRENARVYFDYNPPLETNEVVLIFDNSAPSSIAKAELKNGEAKVSVNGSDDGSGVNSINVLLIKKGSDKGMQATVNPGDTISFKVDEGSTYYVYSSAIDNAGNIEYKENPDAVINTPSSILPLIIVIIAAIAIAIIIVIINKKRKK